MNTKVISILTVFFIIVGCYLVPSKGLIVITNYTDIDINNIMLDELPVTDKISSGQRYCFYYDEPISGILTGEGIDKTAAAVLFENADYYKYGFYIYDHSLAFNPEYIYKIDIKIVDKVKTAYIYPGTRSGRGDENYVTQYDYPAME